MQILPTAATFNGANPFYLTSTQGPRLLGKLQGSGDTGEAELLEGDDGALFEVGKKASSLSLQLVFVMAAGYGRLPILGSILTGNTGKNGSPGK